MAMGKTYFMGGPLDGFTRSENAPPPPVVHIPFHRHGDSAFYTLAYKTMNVPRMRPDDVPDRFIGLFMGQESRTVAVTNESGLLCAHCGRDPATGKEAD